MKRLNRILAAFLIAAFLTAMLFSAAFIVSRANHDCHGHGCQVCVCLNVCRTTLDTLSALTAVYAILRLILCGYVFFSSRLRYGFLRVTLVGLKVRLSD